MNLQQLEMEFEEKGYWVVSIGHGLYQLQLKENGEYLKEEYNLESLEEKQNTEIEIEIEEKSEY